MRYDVFICHASEDKNDFVRPLAELLKEHNIDVWYDEFSLSIGDSLTQKIEQGLSNSNFGVVVLSPNFFNKPWAKRELNGLTMREMVEDKNLILPIWHRVTVQDVLKFSPTLADKKAASSSDGINSVFRTLAKKIRPDESPLLTARSYLNELHVETPPISDEWWLDMIEYKEYLRFPDINFSETWTFPLPYDNEDSGRKRGLNIANAVLQCDWSFDAKSLNICSVTPPEQVQEFIKKWPGLLDYCKLHPQMLALYAPQLTIPGFDLGFEDEFDKLLNGSPEECNMLFNYSRHSTQDDGQPLCPDIISLRHPSFGNYADEELAHWYFDAHDGTYYRCPYSVFQGLIWLLSDDSDWLPNTYRASFLSGIRKRDRWLSSALGDKSLFLTHLLEHDKQTFRFTKPIEIALENLITTVSQNMKLTTQPSVIKDRFMEHQFVEAYYDYIERRDHSKFSRGKKRKPNE